MDAWHELLDVVWQNIFLRFFLDLLPREFSAIREKFTTMHQTELELHNSKNGRMFMLLAALVVTHKFGFPPFFCVFFVALHLMNNESFFFQIHLFLLLFPSFFAANASCAAHELINFLFSLHVNSKRSLRSSHYARRICHSCSDGSRKLNTRLRALVDRKNASTNWEIKSICWR